MDTEEAENAMSLVAIHYDAKAIESVEHSATIGWGAP